MNALSPARVIQPFNAVRDFESALCEYTGAPYAVAVSSCTMALLLAVAWHIRVLYPDKIPYLYAKASGTPKRPVADHEAGPPAVEIPKRTYVSVPQSIIHAGGRPTFRDEDWTGVYQLKPLPVFDSARWLTSGMYRGKIPVGGQGGVLLDSDCSGQFVCVSFHASKILSDTQGGAILHDSPEADSWLRRARFDGRTEGVAPKDDHFDMLGWHAYLSPDVATRLLWKLSVLPKHNDPLPNDDYPDLSRMEIFK